MSRVYRCNCGSVAKYNDLCHHGIADGVCCTCALCNEFCVNCGTGDERLLKCFPDRLMCIECIEEEDELRPKVRIHYDVKKTIRVRRAKEPTCENCGKKEKECDVFAYGENITAYNNQMLCPDCIPEEIDPHLVALMKQIASEAAQKAKKIKNDKYTARVRAKRESERLVRLEKMKSAPKKESFQNMFVRNLLLVLETGKPSTLVIR